MSHISRTANRTLPDANHLDDLKLAASKLLGAERRAFQAVMALKYLRGEPSAGGGGVWLEPPGGGAGAA